MFLFILFALSFSFERTTQELAQCRKSVAGTSRISLGAQRANVVHAIAGRNTSLTCEAFEKFDLDDDCSPITVKWYLIKDDSTPKIVAWWASMKKRNSTSWRYEAIENELRVNFAHPFVDNSTFYCEVVRHGTPFATRQTSFITLFVATCPRLVRKAYRGGPCYYGFCYMANQSSLVVLKCACLPGYSGEFCEKADPGVGTLPYWHRLLTWTPIIVLLVGLAVGILLYENGPVELIFEDARYYKYLSLENEPKNASAAKKKTPASADDNVIPSILQRVPTDKDKAADAKNAKDAKKNSHYIMLGSKSPASQKIIAKKGD